MLESCGDKDSGLLSSVDMYTAYNLCHTEAQPFSLMGRGAGQPWSKVPGILQPSAPLGRAGLWGLSCSTRFEWAEQRQKSIFQKLYLVALGELYLLKGGCLIGTLNKMSK